MKIDYLKTTNYFQQNKLMKNGLKSRSKMKPSIKFTLIESILNSMIRIKRRGLVKLENTTAVET